MRIFVVLMLIAIIASLGSAWCLSIAIKARTKPER